jgi:hypothetical protein
MVDLAWEILVHHRLGFAIRSSGVAARAQTVFGSATGHINEFTRVKAIGATGGLMRTAIAQRALFVAIVGSPAGSWAGLRAKPRIARIDLNLALMPTLGVRVFAGKAVRTLTAAILSYSHDRGTRSGACTSGLMPFPAHDLPFTGSRSGLAHCVDVRRFWNR